MSKKFLIITILSFIAFLLIAPSITGNIGVAIATFILLIIMLMSLFLMAQTDEN